uniref:Ribosomal protein S12 n=1 Tax=Didymium iridis TaxID=5793 RepID=D3X9X5_9MYCE|nr:ribosomal protein S12 [Didymium iridis]ADD25166.1 ribosomal protein S12 [Didymium iridis]
MVTFNQYIKNHRQKKLFKSSTPHFEGSPFKNATCIRVGVVKPKKPNSAQRKITKVCLSNGRYLIAYIPGFGHRLQKNNEVMVRGGRVPDLPGVRYHLLRGKKDFVTTEIGTRTNRRSKFGTKHPKGPATKLNPRLARKAKRRKERETKNIIDTDILKERKNLIQKNLSNIINQ